MDGQIDFQEFLQMMRGSEPCEEDSPLSPRKGAMAKTKF